MASSSPQPGSSGKAKPEPSAKPAPPKTKVVSARVFNDFAAI